MKSAKSAKSADVLFRVIGVICAILVAAALWALREPTRSNPTRYRVVQRLTAPVGVAAADSFDPVAHAETRWTADDIHASWTRVQSGRSATLRSPRLDLPDDFQGVVIMQSPQRSNTDRAPLFLWSESPTLTDAQFRRNRRELLPRSDSPSLFVPAEALQSDERRPIHYFFLHLPGGGELATMIDSVAIVSSRGVAARGAGVWRIAADGQTRDAVTTRSTVEYLADIPEGAELAFGVRVPSDVQGTAVIRATEVVDGREHLLLESSASAGRWADLRTALRAGNRSSLVLSATASGTPVLASWSTPQILGRDDEAALPNVILYVVDALRADKLGAYGAGGGLTPFLDRLASRGLLFRRAYAAASWTKPSVATLLASMYPWTHALGARHYTDMLPAGVPMLQTVLASSGYVTAQFSPNPFTGAVSGLDRDFDAAFMTTALGHTRAFDVKARDIHDRFLAWLANRPRDRFFAYLHAVDTHPPFSASEGTPPSTAYERAIAEVDREIAHLYSRLEELQVADNTLFVVTADHGEAFGEHGQSGHGQSVYDEEVRVPLLMHWPRRGDPAAIDEPVHSVDVAPTLLHYAGVRFDETRFQGRNVLPASPKLAFEGSASGGGPRRDGAPPPSPVVVTRFTYPEDLDVPGDRRDMHAIVDHPWKLIVTIAPADGAPAPPTLAFEGRASDSGRTRELYRLDSDPGERRNLAAVEATRARRLETALDAFLANQTSARAAFARAHQQPPPRRPVPARDLVDQLRSLGYMR
jgi:arylsulfatase A-like enzyme